ncbi:hypothetical protein [Pseudoxanthomonas mexicana]|uniref:hypothetical protein n=1 Tax=Pseudoxanthomonas mexicana TaxID=128785 RepID=UPI00398AF041
MLSMRIDPSVMGKAEAAFRAAFLRLKLGKPETLPKGTPVTQNNVAREAGKDPSALKKERFPALVREIQGWIATSGAPLKSSRTPREELRAARRRNQSMRDRIEELKRDRDLAQSKLMSAERELLELWREVVSLRQMVNQNVVSLGSRLVEQ